MTTMMSHEHGAVASSSSVFATCEHISFRTDSDPKPIGELPGSAESAHQMAYTASTNHYNIYSYEIFMFRFML